MKGHPGGANTDGHLARIVNTRLSGDHSPGLDRTAWRAAHIENVLVAPYRRHVVVVVKDLNGDDNPATARGGPAGAHPRLRGGVDAPDLLTVRASARAIGGAAARVTQPFRLAGARAAGVPRPGRGTHCGNVSI